MAEERVGHSAGEWQVFDSEDLYAVDRSDHLLIAKFYAPMKMKIGEWDANMALCAAAPDMLALLMEIESRQPCDRNCNFHRCVELRALIAKAQGQAS